MARPTAKQIIEAKERARRMLDKILDCNPTDPKSATHGKTGWPTARVSLDKSPPLKKVKP